MSDLLDVISPRDISVIYGRAAQCQALVAQEIGYRFAETGRAVAVLVDIDRDVTNFVNDTIAWRQAKQVRVGQRMNAVAINIERTATDAQLAAAFRDKGIIPDLVLFVSLAADPLGFSSRHAARYFTLASGLIAPGGPSVIVAAHCRHFYAPEGVPDGIDALWRCQADHALNVTLTGPHAETIELTSRIVGPHQTVIFDDVATKEPANV
jgi:hypothetical protein